MNISITPNQKTTISFANLSDLTLFLGSLKDNTNLSFAFNINQDFPITRDILKEMFRVTSETSLITLQFDANLSNEEKNKIEPELRLVGFKLLKDTESQWKLSKKNWKSQGVKIKKKITFGKKKKKANPFAKKGGKIKKKVNIEQLLESDTLAKNEVKEGKFFDIDFLMLLNKNN